MKSIQMRGSLRAGALLITSAVILFASQPAQGLVMRKMGEHKEGTQAEPMMRRLSVHLPLLQPLEEWSFLDQEKALAGELVLWIHRDGEAEEIVIFRNGKVSDGWKWIVGEEDPVQGGIPSLFESTVLYMTTPRDEVELLFRVPGDLTGIGPMNAGVLPAGEYRSRGRFSSLTPEFDETALMAELEDPEIQELLRALEDLADELGEDIEGFEAGELDWGAELEGLSEEMQLKATLRDWDSEWELQITGDGYLPKELIEVIRNAERQAEQVQRGTGRQGAGNDR